jgi:non-ribosomal peptide synthase protein (TIGR01720 family)
MEKLPVESILGRKGTSCRQWINALLAYKIQTEDERAYWDDIKRAAVISNEKLSVFFQGGKKRRRIDPGSELTGRLLKTSRKGPETRIDDILLSALNMALREMTGMDHHCIMMQSHGRQDFAGGIDVARTMGWFAFSYPVKLPSADKDPRITINRIKETLRNVPHEGIGSGVLGFEEGINQWIPRIYFNYVGEFDAEGQKLAENTANAEIDFLHGFDMEVSGYVCGNKLNIDFAMRLPDDTAVRFTENFLAALRAIVTDCAM